MHFRLKVKGDNYRKTKPGEKGNFLFEVGFDLFTCNPKQGYFKELDEWWLIETIDIVDELPDPELIKVTSKRFNYFWKELA